MSSASGKPGDAIAVEISLNSPAKESPATLKWDTVFPAQLLAIENPPAIGPAEKKSGKALTCAQREQYSYVCILTGGQKPVENGLIAIFHFKIRPEAHTGTSTVHIDHIEAVNKDLKTLKLVASDGTVDIR